MRTLWNCTAGKSLLPPNTNGWFSRIARFKWCQGLLLQLWNSHSQLLTLGFILGIMKRWGPSSASWNRIWLVWSGGNKKKNKRCWQNEWRFYPVQMDQQKVGIFNFFFFNALFLIPADVSSVLGGRGAAWGAGNEVHRGNFLGWAGAVTCRKISRLSDHTPALCGAEHSKIFLLE